MKKRKHPLNFPGSQAAVVTRDRGNKFWPVGTIVEPVAQAEGGTVLVWHEQGRLGIAIVDLVTPIGPVARELLKAGRRK